MLRNRSRRWWALSGCALVLVSCLALSVVAFFLPQEPATAAPFRAARSRWQQRPFKHYRFTLIRYNDINTGGSNILSQNTIEVYSAQTPSSRTSPTIDSLFDDLASYAQTPPCGPNGCGCERIVPQVVYDPQWGYPQAARLGMQPVPIWQRLILQWRKLGGCTVIGFFDGGYEITNFTPLP